MFNNIINHINENDSGTIKKKYDNMLKFIKEIYGKDFEEIHNAYKDIKAELIIDFTKLKILPMKLL